MKTLKLMAINGLRLISKVIKIVIRGRYKI